LISIKRDLHRNVQKAFIISLAKAPIEAYDVSRCR
jgi:hypothetical protein